MESFTALELGNSSTIACTFEWISEVSYSDGALQHIPPQKQNKPLVFIFSDLNTEEPKIKAVGSGDSLYEATPVVLANTPEKAVLMELTPMEKNVFVYTIHKHTGIATWTKQYQWNGPVATLAMGKCSSN